MELLEDGHGEREAALNLQGGRQTCISVGRTAEVAFRSRRGGSYQVRNDFLEELGAFLHLVLGPPQLDDVALLRWVGEVNNHLEAELIIMLEIATHWMKSEVQAGSRGRSPQETCPELL